jgi:hypothetical protein
MEKIKAVTAREFLIMYGPKLAGLRKDAQTMAAAAFRRKHGVSPKECQPRIRQLKELARLQDRGGGRHDTLAAQHLRDAEFQKLSRVFLVIWSREYS